MLGIFPLTINKSIYTKLYATLKFEENFYQMSRWSHKPVKKFDRKRPLFLEPHKLNVCLNCLNDCLALFNNRLNLVVYRYPYVYRIAA